MIDWINTILTSVSMSIDAMTVNATNGLTEKGMKLKKMILISLSYGIFQFVMPCIGYFIGYSFQEALEKYIPWIAFSLLTLLAIKSFIDWLKDFREKQKDAEKIKNGEPVEAREEKVLKIPEILVQDIATSIDALCIGFVYLEYSIPNALIVFTVIGITTFLLSLICVLLAKQVAGKLEKWAGLIAAIVFLGVGLKILLEGIL